MSALVVAAGSGDGGGGDGVADAGAAGLPDAVYSAGVLSATVLVNALFVATLQGAEGQRLVTAGTVSGAGGSWTWSAEPAGRLVVDGPAGRLVVDGPDGRLELVVGDVQAVDLSSPDALLAGDHSLAFTVRAGERLNLRLTGVKRGGDRTAMVDGMLTLDGVVHTVDGLCYVGTEYAEIDSSGSELRSRYHLTGEIRTADARLEIDERWTAQGEVTRDGDAFGRYELATQVFPGDVGGYIRLGRRDVRSGATTGWLEARASRARRAGAARRSQVALHKSARAHAVGLQRNGRGTESLPWAARGAANRRRRDLLGEPLVGARPKVHDFGVG